MKQENVWIEAWNILYDKLDAQPHLILVNADWKEISKEEILELIQCEAYEGYQMEYQEIWFKGQQALRYYRANII